MRQVRSHFVCEVEMRLVQLFTWLLLGAFDPTTLALPQNGLLEGLRKIVSGVTSFNTDVLNDFEVPDSMVPEEFKVIRFGLCGAEPTLDCDCEPGAELPKITFPQENTAFTFKDLKILFGRCRPT